MKSRQIGLASVPQHRGDAAGFGEVFLGIAVDYLDLAAHLEDGLAQAVDAVGQRLHIFAAVDAGAFWVR